MKVGLRLKTLSVFLAMLLPLMAAAFQHYVARISKAQAVALAEQFLITNGYTTQPADTTGTNGALTAQRKKDAALKKAKMTLQPHAFCYNEFEETGWYIGFLSASVNVASLNDSARYSDLPGRTVFVSKDGKKIKFIRNVPLFSKFIKI